MSSGFKIQSHDPNAIYKEWLNTASVIPHAKTRRIVMRKLLLALSIIGVVMGCCFVLAGFLRNVADDASSTGKGWGIKGASQDDDPVTWLKDIEEHRKKGSGDILSRAVLSRKDEAKKAEAKAELLKEDSDAPDSDNEPVLRTKAKSIAVAAAKPKTRSARAAESQMIVDRSDPWSQIYGAATRNTNSSTSTFTASNSEKPKGGADNAIGVRLPVKLKGSAASNPAGPVIAVLLKDVTVGSYELSRGTEFHGETRGSGQGARLMMSFSRIQTKGGPAIKFTGRAISTDGRIGVVGTQSLGRGSDIGSSALSASMRAGGNALSALAGSNPLGAAIDGAVSPMADKAKRLNYEEDVVVLNNGIRFDIHVDEI